jgi:hypothetical protein
MRVVLWVTLAACLTGCSSPAVRCDGHLSPINTPAKVSAPVSPAVPHESRKSP